MTDLAGESSRYEFKVTYEKVIETSIVVEFKPEEEIIEIQEENIDRIDFEA